jgi:hypothetical protein
MEEAKPIVVIEEDQPFTQSRYAPECTERPDDFLGGATTTDKFRKRPPPPIKVASSIKDNPFLKGRVTAKPSSS